jgi:hypothetical protein
MGSNPIRATDREVQSEFRATWVPTDDPLVSTALGPPRNSLGGDADAHYEPSVSEVRVRSRAHDRIAPTVVDPLA